MTAQPDDDRSCPDPISPRAESRTRPLLSVRLDLDASRGVGDGGGRRAAPFRDGLGVFAGEERRKSAGERMGARASGIRLHFPDLATRIGGCDA